MPSQVTTLGRELIRRKLPDKYKHYADGVLDKKSITKMMTDIALHDPDDYVEILQGLNNIGQAVVSTYGRDTALPYADAAPGKETRKLNAQLREIRDRIMDDPKLTEEQKEQKIIELAGKYTDKVQAAVFEDNDKRHTSLASQINSGSRGNKTQLQQLQFGNMLMVDALDRPIPFLHTEPYMSGTSPMAYWVSASSGRKGFWDVQKATGQSGYMGKQVTATTQATPIEKADCGTTDTGIPFPADDSKNVGAVLLKPFHNHPAGSIVTDDMVAEAKEGEEMILRSPLTCKCKYGVCQKCNGLGENGKFPAIGEYVPLNAARSFIEAVTQGGLGCLALDTPVRMADWSVKAVRDIRVGDMVMGTSQDGIARPAKVTALFDKGIQPVYRTTYRPAAARNSDEDFYIDATLTHRIICGNVNSIAKDRSKCNELGTQNKYGYIELANDIQPAGCYWHEPAAFLLGILCGDGCYTGHHGGGAELACFDDLLVDDMNQYLKPLGMFMRSRPDAEESGKGKYRIGDIGIKPGGTGHKTKARRLLEKYGMYGADFSTKKFPNNYQDWDRESIAQFISGLWSADGHISIHKSGDLGQIILSLANLELLKQVRDMLHKFWGIPVIHIGVQHKTMPSGYKSTMYRLAYQNPTILEKLLKEVIKPLGIKALARKEMLNWLASRERIYERNPYKCPFVSQEYLGMQPVMDIEVDNEDHLFLLANGIQCHNSKHKGGVGGAIKEDPEGADQPHGFDRLEQFIMGSPGAFKGAAVLAPKEGQVTSVREAPQGGHYITIGQEVLYANPYRTVKVKPGDKVQPGDVLTNGVPNPYEVTELKGLGSGRKYFMSRLNTTLNELGWGTDRRNLEAFSRSMISKVKITDPDGYGKYLPGDIADYNEITADWEPREDAVTEPVSKAVNKYLEKPVLNYSIGTRITPGVAEDLQKHGFNTVTANTRELPFTAQFLRPSAVLQNDSRWLPRLAGERLRDSLFDAARRGMTDEYDSPSYIDKMIIAPFKPGA